MAHGPVLTHPSLSPLFRDPQIKGPKKKLQHSKPLLKWVSARAKMNLASLKYFN